MSKDSRDFELEAILYDWLKNCPEEEVADSMSNCLNAARSRINNEKEEARKAEEAKKKEEEAHETRVVQMCGLISHYQDYLACFYPSSFGEELSEEEERNLAVSMVDMMDRMAEVGKNLKIDLKFADADTNNFKREMETLFDFFSPFSKFRF